MIICVCVCLTCPACVYAWMLQKKRFQDHRGHRRSQRWDVANLTLSFQDVLFLCFSCCVWLSLVSERIHSYVSEIWAVWDAELVLFYILNKPPSQSLYSSFERERDKLPNQETCHTSPEGSSSLLTRVGCDAHETLKYSLKDHRGRDCETVSPLT